MKSIPETPKQGSIALEARTKKKIIKFVIDSIMIAAFFIYLAESCFVYLFLMVRRQMTLQRLTALAERLSWREG